MTTSRKERVELQKLLAETRLLRLQLTPRHQVIDLLKAVAGFAGVITAFVALAGFLFSFWQYQNRLNMEREARIAEQLNRNIALLSEASAAKQLAGIAALTPLLDGQDSRSRNRVLSVFARILAVEEKPVVRDAIVSSFSSLDSTQLDRSELTDSLDALIVANRSLVIEGDLREKRRRHPRQELKLSGIEARAASLAEAIAELLRFGVKRLDLSGIYCVTCDFSGLDLSGTNFDNSVLYLANFASSTLDGSSFDGADVEHTSFQSASLKAVKLTLKEDQRPGKGRSSYISRLFDGDVRAIYGPNFNCADLREADFSGHPIFGFVGKPKQGKNESRAPIYIFHASFVGADLEGANFYGAIMFGARPQGVGLPFPSGDGSERGEKFGLFEYKFSQLPFETPEPDSYESSLHWLRVGFSGSNWYAAKLPVALQEWLDSNPPQKSMDFGIRKSCVPRSSREGFNPRPQCQFRDAVSVEELRVAFEDADDEALLDTVLCGMQKREVALKAHVKEQQVVVNAMRVLAFEDATSITRHLSKDREEMRRSGARIVAALTTVGLADLATDLNDILAILPSDASEESLSNQESVHIQRRLETFAAKLERERKEIITSIASFMRSNMVAFIDSEEPNERMQGTQ